MEFNYAEKFVRMRWLLISSVYLVNAIVWRALLFSTSPVISFRSNFCMSNQEKGRPSLRNKMRNYITGNMVEKTFRAGSSQTTYEDIRLGEKEFGDKTKWLKEGMDCNVQFWNGKVIDFELPITVKLKVIDVDPGLRGGSKPVTLDTCAVMNVPLFVNVDDGILVDKRTGKYMSRA